MESGGVRIGTCSWTEKSLVESGAFYPDGTATPEDRLRYYASRFDTVEVDSSYFSIPTLPMARAWADRTPEGFLFHLKAFGALTGHGIDPRVLPRELKGLLARGDRELCEVHVSEPKVLKAMARAMVSALEPLRCARKLGFVLFQFSPWFSCKNSNRDYLIYCKELLSGLPIAVEFRHGSWLSRRHVEESLAFLREQRITYVTCDEPQYGTFASVPFLPETTTPVAYLRLQGRNAETWLGNSPLRYDYRYADDELREIAAQVKRIRTRARTTFVMFKNCHGGYAVENAGQLRRLLEEVRSPPSPPRPSP